MAAKTYPKIQIILLGGKLKKCLGGSMQQLMWGDLGNSEVGWKAERLITGLTIISQLGRN